MSSRPVLVVGATGAQGGATARALLDGGWAVRALTRDATGPGAVALAAAGAEVVVADLDDGPALRRAARGAHGVFSVQNFMTSGLDGEVRQGRAVADAAAEEGVAHLVYTSVGGAERNSGVPHFETKWAIERHIAELRLPATVLRPTLFMDNFGHPQMGRMMLSTLHATVAPDRAVQMVAVKDIGAFAALAFGDPQRWVGRAVELAGDAVTLPHVAERLASAQGEPGRAIPPAPPGIADGEMGVMGRWFDEHGYAADIPALRREYPDLLDLDGWLAGRQLLARPPG